MKKEVEILWNGKVHYRRLEGDQDITKAVQLIKNGNTLCSVRKREEEKKKR